jgi:hypothetical protein
MIVWLVVLSGLLLALAYGYGRVLASTRRLTHYADSWSKQHERQLNEHTTSIRRNGESIAGLDAAMEILLAAMLRTDRKTLREQLKGALGDFDTGPEVNLKRIRTKIRENERGAG